jgi:ribonuclease P protein component
MKGRFTFSKEEKLCYKKNIDRLFNEGRSFTLHPVRVFYLLHENSDEFPSRVLIAIPKKSFKRAVHRNRLRRLIREAYRLNKSRWLEHLNTLHLHIYIGFIYIGNTHEIPFNDMENTIKGCLDRLLDTVKGGG